MGKKVGRGREEREWCFRDWSGEEGEETGSDYMAEKKNLTG